MTPTTRADKLLETRQSDPGDEPDKPSGSLRHSASHEAPESESSSGPVSTEATSGRICRPQSVPGCVKRRCPCNAGGAHEAPSVKRGPRRSPARHIDGPGAFTRSRARRAAELTGESFRRYPRGSASPTLPERSGPRDLRRTSGRIGPSSRSVTGLFHVEHGQCRDSFFGYPSPHIAAKPVGGWRRDCGDTRPL